MKLRLVFALVFAAIALTALAAVTVSLWLAFAELIRGGKLAANFEPWSYLMHYAAVAGFFLVAAIAAAWFLRSTGSGAAD